MSQQLTPTTLNAMFTKEEDKELLILVTLFEDNGIIDWDNVLTHMQPTSKTIPDLQTRLTHLTITNTTTLHELPPTFTAQSSLDKARINKPPQQIYAILEDIFGHITKADVRQPRGKQHYNTGELAPAGVTKMLEMITLESQDRFLDIGSGVGSIVAQVLFQSSVQSTLGIEIQEELAKTSRAAIAKASKQYTRLSDAGILEGDIKSLINPVEQLAMASTVVYSNNKVFEPEANLKLMEFLCSSDQFRLVILSEQACPRCSATCGKTFCLTWMLDGTVTVPNCWSPQEIELYIYKRKRGKRLVDLVDEL